MSIDTHEEFPAVPTKTVLTVMGDHLNGSPVHYLIDAPKFHYDGVHAVGPKFYEDMFINIGKKRDDEENYEFHNSFHND